MAERPLLLLSGLAGLIANAVLFSVAALIQRILVPPLFSGWLAGALLLFCLLLSVAEIPIMVVALRKLAADPHRKSPALLALTNALYVFFAAVYASLFVLLTGQIGPGLGLSGLGIVRLASSLVFVAHGRPPSC